MSLFSKRLSLILCCFVLLIMVFQTIESRAQEGTADYERRFELAQEVHRLHPITLQIEGDLNALSENLSPAERRAFKRDIIANMDIEALELASITAMARVFTAEELQLMIDYYGSPEAESIAEKSPRYRRIIDPQIVESITNALSLLGMQLGWLHPVPQ